MGFKNMFSFRSRGSTEEDRVVQYVIREHDRGRSLSDILGDRYVVERLTSPEQRAHLLERPEVVHAVGGGAAAAAGEPKAD